MNSLATSRIAMASQVTIAVCLSTIVVMEYVAPFLAARHYGPDYGRLAAECDLAMHDEAALRAGTAGGAKDKALAISADIGLAVCHDYDKLRKRMLILGVSEERLALIGLESLEIEQIPVQRMVQPHRMDRF
jgi:hypothetical protein